MEILLQYFNMTLLVKWAFICMFIIITIYSIFIELQINLSSKKGNISKYLRSGPDGLRKSVLEVLAVIGGLSSIYSLSDQMIQKKLKDKEAELKLAEAKEQARIAQEKVIATSTESTILKAKVAANCDKLQNYLGVLKECQITKSASQSKILELTKSKFETVTVGQQVVSSSITPTPISEIIAQEQRTIDNMELLERRALNNIASIKKELSDSIDMEEKSKFIGNYFSDYFTNLDLTGQVAVSVLVLNQALLSALSTLIFIFYGEILLKKYNVETRWPRLAKLIQLRRKFQFYYFTMSVLVIASIALGEILICIKILTA